MCERCKVVIPGLLKSRDKLENSLAKARHKEKVLWAVLVVSWDAYCNVLLWREWWIRWTEVEDFGIGMKGGVYRMHYAFGMGSIVLVV
ncbi:hypothetical protein ACE6H2_015427 [Prunus campanulata]